MTAPTRLLLLGLDAASPELLDRWCADGTMPNLARLVARGRVARTRGVEGFEVGSTWPSFYTGTNPARHGVHYLVQLTPGTYDLERVAEGAFVRREPFWRALAGAGRRVALIDVPLTRLDDAIDGIQVVEWGGHDSLYGFRTHPAPLADELRAHFGAHPLGGSCDRLDRTVEDYRAFVVALEEGARMRGRMTRELLARGGWDLFAQVFTESHCVGHQCWHLHDAAHPAHDPRVADAIGDPLRRVYAAIDAAIGEIIAVARDTTVIAFAAHGMAHAFGAQSLLPEILARLGVTTPLARAESRRSLARASATRVWRALPASARASLAPLRDRLARVGTSERARTDAPMRVAADTARSLCFPVGNGNAAGGIRLNLVGREPTGALEPGAEADAFCARLESDLLAIVDERTGRPLVRRVVRTASRYAGEHLDLLPDLLVEWSDETPVGSLGLTGGAGALVRARSPGIGVIEGASQLGRSGEHRPGGWLVAAGPGIAPGRVAREVSLLDLAPTIARALGVTLEGCDGRVVEELIAGADRRRD